MCPALSCMAIDILSVQATSVASEFAFSTSGRVLSIRRTRLTPAFLEMCMCLKDHLDAQERKQDKSTLETPVDFEEEILDADVQANEAIPLSNEEIALDVASSECSMSEPGSGGEEADANYGEMTDGEESLRGIAARMNKMTGKSGSGTSQTHTTTRVLVNPNSGHDVLQGMMGSSGADVGLNQANQYQVLMSNMDTKYPSIDGYAYNMVGEMHDAATGSKSLSKGNAPHTFTSNISQEHVAHDNASSHGFDEIVYSEQRDGVTNIVGVQLESLLSDNNDITSEKPSDPIVQSVDINPTPTSYAGAAGASTIGQSKVNSNFRTLVAEPKFDGVNISILRKVVEKVSLRFEHTLYGYFIGKRIAFPVVEYFVRNKGETWVDTDHDEQQSLIASFIGKHVMLDSYTSSMCSDSWGRSSFARCLIDVNSEADLVDVVTICIPSLIGEDFTKETIHVEYEWRPPKYDVCKIFGHVHDQCPMKVVSHSIVTTFTIVTHTVQLLNDGFQTVSKKKKKKNKPKSTNGSQFVGSLVKHNVRYEPEATTSQPKKVATVVGNASKLSSKSKSYGTSSKEGNVTTSNSYYALENDEYEDEEHVENLYDESANLFSKSRAGEMSSFTTGAG
uniref:Zinc knuckle CX2CX4HX4C n=1 Tax=Tanacetum cinerariifolium TaxID=118510 RepID=A0A699HTU1_TANCI|nr:zinc knuckle CX2CX4HX4C [Tanacetum cinerariifolium]